MKKLINYLFKSYIEKKAKELIQDHIKERVSAHDKMMSRAKIDTRVILATDDDQASLCDSFGITDEVKEKMTKVLAKATKNNKTFASAIEEVSTQCVHPNVLAYASFMIGTYAANQQHMMESPIGGLLGMLNQMKRRNQQEED